MNEEDKNEVERWAREFLGIMDDENFSLAQQTAVIEFMQNKLFPPIKLMVGGRLVEIPSAQAMVFESQFAELKSCCRKNCDCSAEEWARKSGSDASIIQSLKCSHLPVLATETGIAFLKHKLKINERAAAA
ncbi:MAG TPA: hypothetical protein DDY52_03940 [Candidatus Moranbacteria bacterium]|nr:hypothetical protein [Candidatus Moranbacteria bacterium]